MGRGSEVIFTKKIGKWQQLHEKVLKITHHQRNAYQNHNNILPHTFYNNCHQKDQR